MSGKETDKKGKYVDAIAIAKHIFQKGKLNRLQFDSPDEPRETHVMNLYIEENSDLDGPREIKEFCELLSHFDYVTFELDSNNIMIGCMIEDVYIPNGN